MKKTPNKRADVKNPNNDAYKADRTNRNKQRKSNNRKTGNNKSGKKK